METHNHGGMHYGPFKVWRWWLGWDDVIIHRPWIVVHAAQDEASTPQMFWVMRAGFNSDAPVEVLDPCGPFETFDAAMVAYKILRAAE